MDTRPLVAYDSNGVQALRDLVKSPLWPSRGKMIPAVQEHKRLSFVRYRTILSTPDT